MAINDDHCGDCNFKENVFVLLITFWKHLKAHISYVPYLQLPKNPKKTSKQTNKTQTIRENKRKEKTHPDISVQTSHFR